MFTGIDVAATNASWKSNGFSEMVSFDIPVAVNCHYTYDIMSDFLTGKIIPDGSSLSVDLTLTDGRATKYTILFDTLLNI